MNLASFWCLTVFDSHRYRHIPVGTTKSSGVGHPALLFIFPILFLWALPGKHTTHIRFPSAPFLQQMNKCRTHSAPHQFYPSLYLLFGYLVYYSGASQFHSSISPPLSLSSYNPTHSTLSHSISLSLFFFPNHSLPFSLLRAFRYLL